MIGELQLHDATLEHAEACGEIVRLARHEAYGGLGADFIDAMHDNEGGYTVSFESLLNSAHRARVATMGGKLVGLAIMDEDSEQVNSLKLSYLYVDSETRGAGIGTALLDESLEYATGQDYDKFVIKAFSGNTGAIKLYESRGLEIVASQVSPYFRKIGKGVVMAKDLR